MIILRPMILFAALALSVLVLAVVLWCGRSRCLSMWRWVVRATVLTLLSFAAAGVMIGTSSSRLARVILIDRSGSVVSDEGSILEQANSFLGGMSSDDLAAAIVFGKEPSVEVPMSRISEFPVLRSVASTIDETGTDIAAGIKLARSSYPEEGVRQMVILSDGISTQGDAWQEAALAARSGIRLWTAPAGNPRKEDCRIVSFDSPSNVALGEPIRLHITISATMPCRVTLEVRDDLGAVFSKQTLVFARSSSQRVVAEARGSAEGLRCFKAHLLLEDDVPQNNERTAATFVAGKPLVHYFAPEMQESAAKQLLMWNRDFACRPKLIAEAQESLMAANTIIMDDCPVETMPTVFSRALETAVREGGTGLVVLGGTDSFGPGGYAGSSLEKLLPVACEPRGQEGTALVIALDKSGSMAEAANGATKMHFASQATLAAAATMSAKDAMAVLAFDVDAQVIAPLQPLGKTGRLEAELAEIAPFGGTDIENVLNLALKTLAASAISRRHVLLLSDGRSRPFDVRRIIEAYRDKEVTLSVVATGENADVNRLRRLAKSVGGNFYCPSDMGNLREVFRREARFPLRDLIRIGSTSVVMDDGDIVAGIEASDVAIVEGFVLTAAKAQAEVLLATRDGEPILATWRAGLGRVAVLTTSADHGWVDAWSKKGAFAKLLDQMVRWSARPQNDERFAVDTEQEDDELLIGVLAKDETGLINELNLEAVVVGANGPVGDVALHQVGSGRYSGRLSIPEAGEYLVKVFKKSEDAAAELLATTVFSVADYREWDRIGPDLDVLDQLSSAAGGSVLEPGDPVPEDDRVSARYRSIAWVFVLLALAGFLADAVVR